MKFILLLKNDACIFQCKLNLEHWEKKRLNSNKLLQQEEMLWPGITGFYIGT
jgi:hypothetical protein